MSGERVLYINLTDCSFRAEELPRGVLHDFLGGRGLGAYLLSRHLPPNLDPLSPDNPLIFSAGPAQGTGCFYSSRTVLTTKSPLTGIYLYSVASGSFGHQLKKTGFIAIVVAGKASSPTYVRLENGSVQFVPADHIWGKMTLEAERTMLAEANLPKASCVVIGPSGEKQIKMAAIVTEGEQTRTFGRGGGGCVMGSKNLKGIVAFGDGEVPVVNRDQFDAFQRMVTQRIRENQGWAKPWRQYGTGAGIIAMSKGGALPTRNWQSGVYSEAPQIDATVAFESEPRRSISCAAQCPSPCSHIAKIGSGPFAGVWSAGPEYETLYALGSNLAIPRMDAIIAAERICDDYGLDTMSAGVAIGFAMECFERGLLTCGDTGGLDLRFGNYEAMLEMLRQIAEGKSGLPALLGQGVRRAAQEIPGSSPFAMHAKGMELGGYECRGYYGQALQYVLNPRGGCHHALGVPARVEMMMGTGTQVEGKGKLLRQLGMSRMLHDCAVTCTFPSLVLKDEGHGPLFSAFSEEPRDAESLAESAFRAFTLERMINVREGITRDQDSLPSRLLEEPAPEGPGKGEVVKLEALKDDAYRAFEWDVRTGIPAPELLDRLGLSAL